MKTFQVTCWADPARDGNDQPLYIENVDAKTSTHARILADRIHQAKKYFLPSGSTRRYRISPVAQ